MEDCSLSPRDDGHGENDDPMLKVKQEYEEVLVKEEYVEVILKEDYDEDSNMEEEWVTKEWGTDFVGPDTGRKNCCGEAKTRLLYGAPLIRGFYPTDPNESDEDSDVDDVDNDPDYQQDVEAAIADDAHEEDLMSPLRKKQKVSKHRYAKPPATVAEEEEGWEQEEVGTGDGGSTIERNWVKEDISNPPLQPYEHVVTPIINAPFWYFTKLFDMELLDHLVYQTNLYASQSNLSTPFTTDRSEMIVFLGILIYMGVIHLSCIEDYWATDTRVPQVADFMTSKRFRLMRAKLHFADNQLIAGTQDRFYKIRPVINAITKNFLKIPETPYQSVDEVMVAHKGTRAGNMRQYFHNKPYKWGYKFFCRASIDGIIHDILMYQGQTTFISHPVQVSKEEAFMNMSAKVVTTLVRTLKHPGNTSVYANNFFTSINLVEHLKETYNCRYVGTARETRTGKPGLTSTAQLNSKKTKRGTMDYKNSNGILALKWKDNKIVNILSSDAGVEPMTTVKRYDREAHEKVDIQCPDVIKQYIGKMGGIDKSDMLTHLYKTPLRSRRWPLKIFGYCLDVCIANAWLLYKRDVAKLAEKPMPLKNFRLSISRYCRLHKKSTSSAREGVYKVVLPNVGQRTPEVPQSVRDDTSNRHVPIFTPMRQTCKQCSTKQNIHRSRWMCNVCNVALCLSDTRNCFATFHNVDL